MSFLIEKGKPLCEQFRAVLRKRLQKAVKSLRAYGPGCPQGLHSARKDLKRSRSMLKLLRGKGLRREGKALDEEIRAIARGLSINRDREVLASLLGKWRKEAEDPQLREGCQRLMAYLGQGKGEIIELDAGQLEEAVKGCQRVRKWIKDTDLAGLDKKGLQSGAEMEYKKLQEAWKRYHEAPGAEVFHHLRKCTKNHLYHRQLLRKRLDLNKSRTRRMRKFEKYLGRIRDCDLLLQTVANHWDCGLDPDHVAALVIKAETQREGLLARVEKLGRRLLGDVQSPARSK